MRIFWNTCFFSALVILPLSAKNADILWFQGGQDILSLGEIPAETDYSLALKGKSTQPVVMITVGKSPKDSTSTYLPVSSGSFSATYLFNKGPGKYSITVFAAAAADGQLQGVAKFSIAVKGKVPAQLPGKPLDARILSFVDQVKGSQVGRGECWDVAQQALDDNGADWNRPLDYGKKINPQDAKPGDIVQFKSVKMVETFPDGSWRSETLGMPDHTAIIYEVISPLKFRLAHQNLSGNRTVQITEVNLKNKKSGSFSIHRPRAGLLLD